jgi:hypothetical protein
MRPDYPHKLFKDQRNDYYLLMETLAMDMLRAASYLL